jgi:hypothetical protein
MLNRKISDLEAVPKARYIFESPDGGHTIYQREIGTDTRYLVKTDPVFSRRQQAASRLNRLTKIVNVADTDPTIKDALEHLEALYILKYGNDKNN